MLGETALGIDGREYAFMGTELDGKTIGIIGFGRIGMKVAKWARSFGMDVLAYDPLLSSERAKELRVEPSDLDTIWRKSDFITLHVPKTDQTAAMVNDASLAKCKDGVRIINCARGGVVDEAALLRGLESGKVGGAALDVYETEPPPPTSMALLQHENVIATPHLGASTEEAQLSVAEQIAVQMADAFEGK